jgi:cob(I)alamin adenosyltransferase
MSITTKRGDKGETDLMFGRRVSKDHLRIIAVGEVDELNASLGIVRALSNDDSDFINKIETIQKDLIILMGEISTLPEDIELYKEKGFECFGSERVQNLEKWIKEIEDRDISLDGWALPGSSGLHVSAHLDYSRTICRRAERGCIKLEDGLGESVIIYLNRLSDLLWLMARDKDSTSPS